MIAWFTRRFRRASRPSNEPQAHLTFGGTSVGRSLSRTGLLLKKQLWIWPIIAVVLLASVGYGVRVAIERTMQRSLVSELETLLHVERSMLETWLAVQEANAASLANDQQVREVAAQMLDAARVIDESEEESTEPMPAGSQHRSLRMLNTRLAQELGPGMSAHHFVNYFLADKEFRILASSNSELMGKPVPPQYEAFIARSLAGDATVSPPFPSTVAMKDEFGRIKTGVPTMHVCVPVRDAAFQIVAVLGLRIRPEREFTNILQLGRIGESGETYAIDKKGNMVSNSRFDDDLILMGLLPDEENSRSLLNLMVRDPGGDLTAGYRPRVRRAELPLTRAAAEAISAGASGVDVVGYRDYRGAKVVGAWQWIPKYDMGVITEIDHAEAYRPLSILRWAFFSLLGLLVLSSAAIFVFTLVVARLQREAQHAAIEARHLGQYRLEERIGAGGMGVVYRGHHAMLRRPTAIKLLDVEKVNETSIARFEREVQITCKLNHPNTVAIYDYGRTPEGVFYYAMEYLDGIDLEQLVRRYGPQPEGRVIKILQQICGSLYEAHSLGLVHRDIKPANAMLNRRGGEPDVIKVLDFGLVKALDSARQAENASGLAGTPLYMSPEAIQTPELVDGRSDLYAVGAVGYFLITGQPLFSPSSLVELCHMQVEAVPDTPSIRLGRPVSAEFEGAIMACLEKSRARRPQTARELATLLEQAPTANAWTLGEAEAWWGRHERTMAASDNVSTVASNGDAPHASVSTSGRTSAAGLDQTMAHPGS